MPTSHTAVAAFKAMEGSRSWTQHTASCHPVEEPPWIPRHCLCPGPDTAGKMGIHQWEGTLPLCISVTLDSEQIGSKWTPSKQKNDQGAGRVLQRPLTGLPGADPLLEMQGCQGWRQRRSREKFLTLTPKSFPGPETDRAGKGQPQFQLWTQCRAAAEGPQVGRHTVGRVGPRKAEAVSPRRG